MLPDFRVRQRDYLLEIARSLTQDLDLENLLGKILSIAIEMLAGRAGLIALKTEEGAWKVQVSEGLAPSFLRFIEQSLGDFKDLENLNDSELPEIGRRLNELIAAASMGQLTSVGLPLTTQQRVVGAIFIFRGAPNIFSSNDRTILSSFANQAAIAVQNAQLYQQVTREKQRTDALLDSAADGILILNPDLSIKMVNDALGRMLSYDRENIIGRFHENIIRWKKIDNGSSLEEATAGGWPLTSHATLYVEGDIFCGQEQQTVPVGITYAPLMSETGHLLNIIATVRDITRFRQAEELKSTFISIISHELKTPVALIKGYVSTLRRDDASWDRKVVDESLKVIEEEADHLAELIDNLLDATRLQAGGAAIRKSDVYIPELARQLAERFQKQTTNHEFEIDFPEGFPVVLADEDRIRQVISNLISNALKYAKQGKIGIKGSISKEQVIVCISDQGPGIASNDIPHVFDRFYRASDMAKKTKGAGLGLFLARSIIEAHNGKIWVDAGAQKGARICFSLPLS